jgi:hypothetical protein
MNSNKPFTISVPEEPIVIRYTYAEAAGRVNKSLVIVARIVTSTWKLNTISYEVIHNGEVVMQTDNLLAAIERFNCIND